MSERSPPRTAETEEERLKRVFDQYACAVGWVSHSWNYLQEALGEVFVSVIKGNRNATFAVWYSTDNDRLQRKMLELALKGIAPNEWHSDHQKAAPDILWVISEANKLADRRNDAVHLPVSAAMRNSNWTEMFPSLTAFVNGHPRARKLSLSMQKSGQRLLTEFDICARKAGTLREFTKQMVTALDFPERYPWPDRPSLQIQARKSPSPNQPRQAYP
jgi:hypothetical protein